MKKTIVMLLAVLLLLTACGSGNTPAATTADGTLAVQTEVTKPVETEPERYTANVPDANFNGATYHVGGIPPSQFPTLLLEFDFEEDTGEVVQSAIYNRNRYVEEKYKVKFENDYFKNYSESQNIFQQFAIAGDSTYQMIMLICRHAFPASIDGYVLPYEELPYLDYSQPWYLHDINEMMSIKGQTVLAYTDLCMNAKLQTVIVFCNKNVLEMNQLQDPYTLVRDGKWTQDLFYEMAQKAVRDVNGDGQFTKEDAFGIISEDDFFFGSTWVGAGASLITKDKDGVPKYTAASDQRLIDILEKLSSQLKTPGFFWNDFKVFGRNESSRQEGNKFFMENGALFRVGFVGFAGGLREMEADFGILPLPKYDEDQDNYYNRTVDGFIYCVPNVAQNKELVGTMYEALSAETKNFVLPAYYDVALTFKYTRDKDSEEMLDLIFDSLRIDLGDTIWMNDFRAPLGNQIMNVGEAYASYLKSIEESGQKTIDDVVKALDEKGAK